CDQLTGGLPVRCLAVTLCGGSSPTGSPPPRGKSWRAWTESWPDMRRRRRASGGRSPGRGGSWSGCCSRGPPSGRQ
ncbi:hypothetical protein E3U43_007418, partial [Larimichthys crocea]